jgi:phosphoglycolate phosphatase
MKYHEKSYKWTLEVINNETRRGGFKSALFDFDGTVSLIRQGWQDVMLPYFIEVLKKTPMAEDEISISSCVSNFVNFLTGKQTIYQCIRLDEEVQKRGGKHLEPVEYKREYHRRLMAKIAHRLEGLRKGEIDPKEMIVPGFLEFIKIIIKHDLTLYLASGTDEDYVLDEARLLGVFEFFNGGIYGAKDQYKLFSKSMVVKKIIETHEIKGHELVGFGDGYVEIEDVKNAGGFAVGLATDEEKRRGVDKWKRDRLIKGGADIIIPDFCEAAVLDNYLFNDGGCE